MDSELIDNRPIGWLHHPNGALLSIPAVPEVGYPQGAAQPQAVPGILWTGSNQANSTWDQRQRLTSLQLVGGSTQTYTYDSENHRLSKTHNGQTTSYVQNPHGTSGLSEILIERLPGGEQRHYVWGGPAGLLYEERSDGTLHYYHGDLTGNTVALTDQEGHVTTRWQYSPYGMVMHKEGTQEVSFLYGGAYGVVTDKETGLIHMRARYYHPHLCRFLSEDPIGFDGGMNWYAYCSGEPFSRIDPSGNQDFGLVFMNQKAVSQQGVEKVVQAQVAAHSTYMGPAAAVKMAATVAVRAPRMYITVNSVLDETGVIAAGLGTFAWRTSTRHHIATIRNTAGTRSGGPYTPKFEEIFARFGQSMDSAENTLQLPFHRGPHAKYNEMVYNTLRHATTADEFTKALSYIKMQTGKPGTPFNSLATSQNAAPFFQGNNNALSSSLQRVLQAVSH